MKLLLSLLLCGLTALAFAGRRDDLAALTKQTNDLKKQEQTAPPEKKDAIKQQIDETLGKIDKVGDEAPKDGDTQKDVARAFLTATEPSRALSRANQAVALNPQDPEAHAIRAQSFYEMKRYDEAVADAKQALALDPSNKEAQAVIALAHNIRTGKVPSTALKPAGGDMAGALNGQPGAGGAAGRAGATATMVAASGGAGPGTAAGTALAAGEANAARMKAAELAAQGTAKLGLGDKAAARTLLDKAVALDPKSGEARLARAKALLGANATPADKATAVADAREAAALMPKSGMAQVTLAQALEASAAPGAEILAAYQKAAEMDTTAVALYQKALQRYAAAQAGPAVNGAPGAASSDAAPAASSGSDGRTGALLASLLAGGALIGAGAWLLLRRRDA